MPDVFILGAGFSKAISSHMPVLGELSQAVRERLGDKFSGLLPLPDFGGDVELLLTYLSQKHPWQSEPEAALERAAFLRLQEAIAEIIGEAEAMAFAEGVAGWLGRLLKHRANSQSRFLTLNYDTCVERPLGEEAPWVRYGAPIRWAGQGGLTQPAVREVPTGWLLKLHGSARWFHSGTDGFAGEQVWHLPITDRDHWTNVEMWDMEVTPMAPLIIPPVADKNGFYSNLTLRAIWRQAAEALRGATRVFCLGYSMPLTDLTMRFLLATQHPSERAEFHIVNRAEGDAKAELVDRYGKCLPAEAYGIRDNFVHGGAPIPEFVEWLLSEG